MKTLSSTLALALLTVSIAAPAMASPHFSCPGEDNFLPLWNSSVKAAHTIDLTVEGAQAQADAYTKIWANGVPNKIVRTNTFTLNDREYDLVVIAGTFTWNPDYLDSYGVIFNKGQAEPLAVIKTDTDRSDYICTELNQTN